MRLSILVAFLLLQIHSYSQENADGNYTVGILPVTSVTNDAQIYTPNVQASLSKVFVEKTRFTVVDRTKFDQLAKERNLQKQEDFLNGAVVEQGKSLGAQYLISGNINQISKRSGNREKSKLDYDAYSKQYYTRKYQVYVTQIDVTINVQIIDVSTGIVKSNKSFTNTTEAETTSEATVINSAILGLEGYLRAWVNDAFPVFMKIIKVETTDKKGLPKTVLIKGGSDVDLAYRKDAGILYGIGKKNVSSELEVFENNVEMIDGKEYKRKIPVGKIKVVEIQGEFSICEVKKGAEEIQKKLNEGKTLFLKIISY